MNALKVTGKKIGDVKVVINGAGSAGTAIGNHLLKLGVNHLIMCDKFGILCEGMEGLNFAHEEMSKKTNRYCFHQSSLRRKASALSTTGRHISLHQEIFRRYFSFSKVRLWL